MNIVLLGISGSGKGTQAEMLADKYGLTHISSGGLFRAEYEKKSPEGLAAYEYWSKGSWVPDETTFNLVKLYLDQAENGFILDGFPRTLNQCHILDNYVSSKNQKIDHAIYLMVSEEEAINRLKKRAVEGRLDETEEIIRARFRSFVESINPILEYYKNNLMEINGERSVEEINRDIISKIEG